MESEELGKFEVELNPEERGKMGFGVRDPCTRLYSLSGRFSASHASVPSLCDSDRAVMMMSV